MNTAQTSLPHISFIVPLYNEASNLASFVTQLIDYLQNLAIGYEIILIDDGSRDNSVGIARQLCQQPNIKLIALSRNFGKELALTAGLEYCTGDAAIMIDADFQHPFATIATFIEKWQSGYEIVYGVRQDRNQESWLKRGMIRFFYHILSMLTAPQIPRDAGDFRLLDRKVITALNNCQERVRFMKGLYAWVGFKSLAIPFEVQARHHGQSRWGFSHLAELAIVGITSFSNIPLRIWSLVGLSISFIAFIYASYIILKTLIFGVDVPGYASILVGITFFGGIQLLSIGILGEYIARIFNEVKQRPKYIVTEKIGFSE